MAAVDNSKMKSVHSYDMFDTLVGRKCGNAKRLFAQIADILEDPAFPEKRIAAERTLQQKRIEYSLDDIYSAYGDCTLAVVEFDLELHNVFPIKRYADRLTNDDIIVSDMYLSGNQLRQLLAAAGIKFTGRIYVSCCGKHTGDIWRNIKANHLISTHRGDNIHNDIQKPKAHGIRTSLAETSFTKAEQFYAKHSEDLAYWLRHHRLEHITDENKEHLNLLQLEFNVSFLWACSHLLAEHSHENKLKKLLFMSRDNCMFQQLFQKLYPDVETEYLYVSREQLISGSDSYFAYLNKRLTKDTSLVDLGASCGSLKAALPRLKVRNPRIWTAIYLQQPWNVDPRQIQLCYLTTNVNTTINNTFLEMLNYALHWHVADVDKNEQPHFDQENEYDMRLVEEYHLLFEKMLADAPAKNGTQLQPIIEYALTNIHRHGAFLRKMFPGHHRFESKRRKSLNFALPYGDKPESVASGGSSFGSRLSSERRKRISRLG